MSRSGTAIAVTVVNTAEPAAALERFVRKETEERHCHRRHASATRGAARCALTARTILHAIKNVEQTHIGLLYSPSCHASAREMIAPTCGRHKTIPPRPGWFLRRPDCTGVHRSLVPRFQSSNHRVHVRRPQFSGKRPSLELSGFMESLV